jgi:uncharacterized protein (TIGR02284 family)
MLHAQALDTLTALIDVCEDTALGFDHCALQVDSPLLSAWLLLRASESRQASQDLQTLRVMMAPMSGSISFDGASGLASAAHPVTLDSMFDPRGDEAVLQACECYEDLALAIYGEALKVDMPPTLGTLVSAQYQELRRRRVLLEDHRHWLMPLDTQHWRHGLHEASGRLQ